MSRGTAPIAGAQDTAGLHVGIQALPLSNRTRSRLLEAGIHTAAELSRLSDDELLAFDGFGHTCLREVRALQRMVEDGLDVGSPSPGDDSFPHAVQGALAATPLAHLPISNRARRVFDREGIRTVADYVAAGELRLLGLRNFGATSLTAVNRAIRLVMHRSNPADAAPPLAPFVGPRRVDERFTQLPVAALDLPRRARRACQELGLRTLKDLVSVPANDLLVRRNFGQATLRRIQHELERFLREHERAEASSFDRVLDQLLGRLQPKERRLVELREGRDGHGPITLTEAGAAMEITESRACQIEHTAWAKLRRFVAGIAEEAADHAVAALLRHGGVAETKALLDSPYFSGSGLDHRYLGRMLVRLLPHRLARLSDGRLAAAPAASVATLAARLRKRLHRSGTSQALDALAADVLRGADLGPEGPALVRALCEALFAREIAPGPDGAPFVRSPTQGLGDDLRRILLACDGPLHFAEIARRLLAPPYLRTDTSEEKVRLRLCRDVRFVLVRRGLYDLRDRFRVEPALRRTLADRALAILQRAMRPTSVALLGSELRRESACEGVNEFVLATVLREDPRFRHLGRGTFVPAGSADQSVPHVSEILDSILSAAGGPLTYAELRRRVQARRQVSDGAISATLVGRDAFLRVARGVFDLSRRHAFDAATRKRLAIGARALLEQRGGVASLKELAAAAAAATVGAVLLGDLLRRHGGFRFLSGGFVSLAGAPLEEDLARRAGVLLGDAREPLRPSTIARRLELPPERCALLRVVLRDDSRFEALPDGRFVPARETAPVASS